MYCPKCGAKNVEEAKFCGSCGSVMAVQTEPAETVNTGSENKAVSTELKIGVAIGTLLIPLIGLIMGGIYMNDANPEKKAVGRMWLFIGLGMLVIYCLFSLAGGEF